MDVSFGGSGKVITPFGTGTNEFSQAVLVQPDGRIVLGGRTINGTAADFALARYLPDGALDGTFNGTGKVTTNFGTGLDSVNGMALQLDGKIVAVGSNGFSVALARYFPNGTLDPTFSGDGMQVTAVGANSAGVAVAVQSDGKIVVCGSASISDFDVVVLRYMPNGNLDLTFGAGKGYVTTPIGSGNDFGSALAIQGDGKILVAGDAIVGSNNEGIIVRYLPDGTLDSTFNGSGKVVVAFTTGNDVLRSVLVEPDNRILVSGFFQASSIDMVLLAYLPNGTRDTTFGVAGARTIDIAGTNDLCYAMARQSDGKIVLGGSTRTGNFSDLAIVRCLSNGALDTTFHGAGKKAFPLSTANDEARAIAIQSDDRIVAAGYANDGTTDDFAVIRLVDGMILPPTLILPANNARTKAPIAVAFTLPEAASPGTVQLRFGGNILTLAPSEESSGMHFFTFDPGNPLGSTSIVSASAGPIVDGRYTVTLSYQDLAGNTAASANSVNVRVDTKPPTGAFSIPVGAVAPGELVTIGAVGWADDSPPLVYQFFFNLVALGPPGSATSAQFKAPAALGRYPAKLRVTDAAGNFAETIATISVSHPPVVRVATMEALSGKTSEISVAKLLRYASDPDGDAIEIDSVVSLTDRGFSAWVAMGVLYYAPPVGFSGADTIYYSVRDSAGSVTTSSIRVTVSGPAEGSLNVLSIAPTADGFRVRFAGVPGESYQIQYRNTLADPWQLLDPPGALRAGPEGIFEHEDKPSPRPTSRFYRAIKP